MARTYTALGLMSGTSLDGVDAAIIVTDGQRVLRTGPSLTLEYPTALRERLRSILGGQGPVASVERDITLFHAIAVRTLLESAGEAFKVDVIGFHGHTILHRPAERRTWQIGDGALLAREMGLPVVNDFRTADVAAGGQGAPLVPVYHAALAASVAGPVAVLNLGGVGNVTWVGGGADILAFDTGPGNALIDDWARRHTDRPMDVDGKLARAGTVHAERVAAFRAHPYFAAPPPKSLDRDDFRHFAEGLVSGLTPADGAATLTEFTAVAVAAAEAKLPGTPKRWLVCGGGRRNPSIMAALGRHLSGTIESAESEGWDGDALEAQAFAFLAVRHLENLPQTFPGTTGAPQPMTGGRHHLP